MNPNSTQKKCKECGEVSIFTPHSSGKNGQIYFRTICNKCQIAKRKPEPKETKKYKFRERKINTGHYRASSYTCCGGCDRLETCRASINRGENVLCNLEENKSRGWWDMDEQVKRLGWDKLPAALGD